MSHVDEQFRQSVREKAGPDTPERCVSFACEYAASELHSLPLHPRVKATAVLAQRVAELSRSEPVAQVEHREDFFDASPLGFLEQSAVLEAIGPDVEDLRGRMFFRSGPPFARSRYLDAVTWIEEEHETAPPHLGPHIAMIPVDLGPWGTYYRPTQPKAVLPYIWPGSKSGPPEFRTHAVTPWQERLWDLAITTERLERNTGFKQNQLVAYVLAGVPPHIPKIELSRRTQATLNLRGRSLVRRTVTITFNDPSFSDREQTLRDLLKRIAEGGTESPKDRADRALELILRRLAPIPSDTPLSFWKENVLPAWLDAGMNVSKSETALQKRWELLRRRRPELLAELTANA